MPPARAVIFIGLNAIRVLSIVTLVLVFASQIAVIVTNVEAVNAFQAQGGNSSALRDCDYINGSTVPNQPAGVFWAVVATLLIIIQSIILLLSEIGWPMRFFDRYFPVLGSEFGLGPLGIFQGLIATQILSHHVDDFTLVSAFFLFAIGCLNMLLGLIFRESAKERRLILSWRRKSKVILPQTTGSNGSDLKRFVLIGKNGVPFVSRSLSTMKSEKEMGYGHGDFKSEYNSVKSTDKVGYGFDGQGEKAAAWKGFSIQKPQESLPRYMSPPSKANKVSRAPSSRSSTSSNEDEEDDETERSPSRARSAAHRSQSRSGHRSEQPGTPVPKFKSSPTAI
ncbi:hypothetical protein APHAL10511_000919 [Amanita phalloides]|nr:hypothetical protein APHAL10511_000919 [Amanita phalloides]